MNGQPTASSGDLAALEQVLGYRFANNSLLVRALTHPSFGQQQDDNAIGHNQRLEFLGDAVLGLILAEQLFATLPTEREGVLTQNRSALAKGAQLASLARDLGLPGYLRLSEAEERNNGRNRDSILEDAFEALIGAIYLDRGYATAREVVLRWYGDINEKLKAALNVHNPKGRLQELIQPQLGNDAIVYELLDETGPAHLKRFRVEVRIDGRPAGTGEGLSKKEAEEQAALLALESIVELP